MEWVDALIAILTAWAWPVVILVIVLKLRKELAGLVGRLSRIAAPGVAAEFATEAQATAELAEATIPNAPNELENITGAPLTDNPTRSDLLIESYRHPVGAMVRAWNMVEYVVQRGFDHDLRRGSISMFVRDLARRGLVDDDVADLARRLQDLRNQVVHGAVVPDSRSAAEFVEATWRLTVPLKVAVRPTEIDPERGTIRYPPRP